jgi:hypothetical protein
MAVGAEPLDRALFDGDQGNVVSGLAPPDPVPVGKRSRDQPS